MAEAWKRSGNCQSACKPGSVGSELPGDHSSGTALARRLEQPTRTTGPEKGWCLRTASSLFGLAPGGVCPAALVAKDAVGSYPTVSPLPRQRFGPSPSPSWAGMGQGPKRRRGGLFSVALSLGSPPPDVIRHRFSVEPGLSSPVVFRHVTAAVAQPTGARYLCAQDCEVKDGTTPRADLPNRRRTTRLPESGLGHQSAAQAKGEASRLVSSRCSVEMVDMSATPSTLAWRKWRWKATVTSCVSASNTPVASTP